VGAATQRDGAKAQKGIMTTLTPVVLKVLADISDLMTGLTSAGERVSAFGADMTRVGGTLSTRVTAPLLAAGGAAVWMANDFNEGMANVASLGSEAAARVEAWGPQVQGMAVAVGKSTSDLTDGLYQVVSAFGAADDSTALLEINARAAAAGLAGTTDAINLTSAVTKGYGDTSAASVQQAADLALMTVQLGQTTFPELAASMGKVVPISSALGITQEELFASMATLTGVTGNAAEVSTQLRATYQALLKPTGAMTDALAQTAHELEAQGQLAGGPLTDQWRQAGDTYNAAAEKVQILKAAYTEIAAEGVLTAAEMKVLETELKNSEKAAEEAEAAWVAAAEGLGPAIVESVGMSEALALLSDKAGGNSAELAKMFGSVEALNAVLALSGPQAEVFAEKFGQISNAAGAADEAFAAQTDGVNKAGFEWKQLKAQLEVTTQQVGQQLLPAFSAMTQRIIPLITWVGSLAERFANLSPRTQTVILAVLGFAVALGPVLVGLGMVVSAIGTLMTVGGVVVGFLTGPAAVAFSSIAALLTGPVVVALGAVALLAVALYVAWKENFGGIQEFAAEVWAAIQLGFEAFRDLFSGDWDGFLEKIELAWWVLWSAVANFKDRVWAQVWESLTGLWESIRNWFAGIDWASLAINLIVGLVTGIQNGRAAIYEAVMEIARSAWDAIKNFFNFGSPSRLMFQAGLWITEGWADGMSQGADAVLDAALGIGRGSAVGVVAGAGAHGGGAVVVHETYNLTAQDDRAIMLYAQMTRRERDARLEQVMMR
jgi:TP901 family phage tail tape measure protein